MKIMKERSAPHLLTVLQILNNRMALSTDHRLKFLNMKKGYEGEIYFDRLLKDCIESECLVLNDLLFLINDSIVQIDCLVITGSGIYLYEIKNYEGEYIHKTDLLRSSTGYELTNPLDQLNRTVILLKQQLRFWGFNLAVKSFVVYVNSSFVLYELKSDLPVVLSGQIRSHLSQLNQSRPLKKEHHYLANKLLQVNLEKSPYNLRLPDYSFDTLKKGITCISCGSYDILLTQRLSSCRMCGHQLSLTEMITSQVEHFNILFPTKQITVQTIVQWCGEDLSVKTIRRVLKSRYQMMGGSKSRYYV